MKFIKLVSLLIIITIAVSGCIIKVTDNPLNSDGGIYITQDAGTTWGNISNLLNVSGSGSFKNASVTVLEVDQGEPFAMYAGTLEHGLLYSIDKGLTWQATLTGVGRINDVQISRQNQCLLYVAVNNFVYRSRDCARNWEIMLREAAQGAIVTSVGIDPVDEARVYAVTNKGAFHQSSDYGVSWQTRDFLDVYLKDIIINPDNGNVIYLATRDKGIYRSLDRALNWTLLYSDYTAQFNEFGTHHQLILDPHNTDRLYYVNDYGILVSENKGSDWTALSLLTPANSIYIYNLAISQQDPDKLYYSTASTFYYSVDSGLNWLTKKIPTSKVFLRLLASPDKDGTIYAGTWTLQ
ncbi:MAG: hypothetical protein AUJ28_02190 [Parcubacteria group bacterium CG1_02_37_51]|uniref:Sortilin N-terminal domain-containing protein n=2 Tax=Candidatus Komeiliibacteriota TaxID=1817908 RepID=A0A2M8DRF9_9BACT|nr:MAG: hypothetical protein AUJ28_02190 [Parcubacteria group bacterium CG1_02_37_51]PIY95334.1 MAG: hypothetical protein COY67_00565 [Candidatus Komeilibacteria bacterium CG_4_10_14_0_8_um_filter_37_78]PJC01932.1 MAG: hypothetical protein CO073_02125 [Candidatus Komeilibacteria bacterium CG_4_9_14_0_8_um_filter_36_9]